MTCGSGLGEWINGIKQHMLIYWPPESMKRTVTVMKCWINDPVYLYISLRPNSSYNLIMKKKYCCFACVLLAVVHLR